MATSNESPTLTSIPLELRHAIFEAAATRPNGPKKTLRRWFEKKDVKEAIAQHMASDPNGVTPRAVYPIDHAGDESDREFEPEEDDSEEEDEDHDQHDEEGEEYEDEQGEDEDEMDNEDEGQEADGDDDGDGNGNDNDNDNDNVISEATAGNDEIWEGENENELDGDTDCFQAEHEAETPGQDHEVNLDGANTAEDEEGEGTVEDDHMAIEGDENGDEDGDGNEVGDGDGSAAVTAQNAQAPVVRPHTKWRHIPNFLRISHNPPPRELFLVSKQINEEAKDWFYDVAIIHIDATGSFKHTSMFEESLQQIVNAAFSPFENIRKVDVKFVWDTEWMRSQDWVEGIFQALLRQRALFVLDILKSAPELQQVVIHWYDSINDDDSSALKHDIAEGFLGLPANVKLDEHYLKPGTKPHRKSIAGRKRLEFQRIVDDGLNFS